MKKIAIEEHFSTEEYLSYLRLRKDYTRREIVEDEKYHSIVTMLLDLGEGRLSDMNESGIDMQVLSLSIGVQQFDTSDAIALAKRTNDELSKIVKKCPERFAGFAALATQDPNAAADELERAVKGLGLKGANISSHIKGEYLDDQKYWVIFERAEKLDVPIYLHPARPSPDMVKPFLTYPLLADAMWGYAAEAGLHAMRLICSGVFDKYPGLKIILGHLGEALPFWLWRIDNRWLKEKVDPEPITKGLKKKPSQYVKDNFFVTLSGMFWEPALLCAYLALGADRILFAVDYPYESNDEAVQFIEGVPICDSDKEKICHINAEKILAL